ncbi:hypothetical protein L9F63_004219, partial [Diploptera punctata]
IELLNIFQRHPLFLPCFPQSSRQILGWNFIIIAISILLQLKPVIYEKMTNARIAIAFSRANKIVERTV